MYHPKKAHTTNFWAKTQHTLWQDLPGSLFKLQSQIVSEAFTKMADGIQLKDIIRVTFYSVWSLIKVSVMCVKRASGKLYTSCKKCWCESSCISWEVILWDISRLFCVKRMRRPNTWTWRDWPFVIWREEGTVFIHKSMKGGCENSWCTLKKGGSESSSWI